MPRLGPRLTLAGALVTAPGCSEEGPSQDPPPTALAAAVAPDPAPLPPRFAALLEFPADAGARRRAEEDGRAAFDTHACWRCHTLGDEEFPGNPDFDNSGPDLLTVGDRLGPAALLRSLVDPGAEIAEPAADHTDSDGRSKMPSFAQTVPPRDLQNLTVFLVSCRAAATPQTPTPPATPVPAATLNVTPANYQREVLGAKGLVLLDFWAEWCAPCKELNPLLDKLAPEFAGRVKICKIDVGDEANVELGVDFRPDSILPCLVLLRDGQLVERRYGTDPEMEPEAFLRQWFTGHAAEP